MSARTSVDQIIQRSQAVLSGGFVPERDKKFHTYAISNFRGGIGKSTLSFNLSFEVAKEFKTLLLDTCSQRNFSQNLLGDDLFSVEKTIYDALIGEIAATTAVDPEELLASVKASCPSFKGGKQCYLVPGSTELYLFPSLLYSTLAQYSQIHGGLAQEASARVINSVRKIIREVNAVAKPEKTLIDTSPFFGGATHLAWAASDALIIPVRVDQHSVEALRLTLRMLTDKKMDFHRFNKQAGIDHQPIVHAIVMTHCGWSRQKANTPDSSTRFFVEQAVDVAEEFADFFSESEVHYCFYLLDDFHSCGRISGKQRIPISELISGQKYPVDGQRLEVNPSVDRYKKEIKNLASDL